MHLAAVFLAQALSHGDRIRVRVGRMHSVGSIDFFFHNSTATIMTISTTLTTGAFPG